MHAWWDPFERVLALGAEHGIAVATPMMGERVDLAAPHAGERWWRALVSEVTQDGAAPAPRPQPR
jgi:hypothetical protein